MGDTLSLSVSLVQKYSNHFIQLSYSYISNWSHTFRLVQTQHTQYTHHSHVITYNSMFTGLAESDPIKLSSTNTKTFREWVLLSLQLEPHQRLTISTDP